MVKTPPSNVGHQGAKISWPKTKMENRSNIVTNSIKTLKMVHIKKIFRKKRKKEIGTQQQRLHCSVSSYREKYVQVLCKSTEKCD